MIGEAMHRTVNCCFNDTCGPDTMISDKKIERLPPVLLLSLQKWNTRVKHADRIKLADDSGKSTSYGFIGCVRHSGTHFGGHYTTYYRLTQLNQRGRSVGILQRQQGHHNGH